VYKQLPFNNKIEIFCQKNKFNEYILNNLQPLNYKPTFYMPTCFLQMVYHHYFPRPIIKFKREYIKTEDGGVFSMDWVIDGNSKVNNIYKKLLVIFHGATGGSEAGYIREILEEFIKKDEYKLVVVHNRGISDTPLYTPLSFHASYFYDQKYSLEIIQQRFPDLFCFTLGVSMGANIFTKLISNLENDDKLLNYIRCFVSVSNPLNFLESEKRNRGSIMDKHLKNCLKKYYLKHKILRHNKGIFFN
jgi:predicted alpha/beta-fold hydrolase